MIRTKAQRKALRVANAAKLLAVQLSALAAALVHFALVDGNPDSPKRKRKKT